MTAVQQRVSPPPTQPSDTVDDRRHLVRRVRSARREALVWASSTTNASRIGAYLTSYDARSRESFPAGGRTLDDYCTLLQEWGVPGVLPPSDLDAAASDRWSRSVTPAVLRRLRRDGHLL